MQTHLKINLKSWKRITWAGQCGDPTNTHIFCANLSVNCVTRTMEKDESSEQKRRKKKKRHVKFTAHSFLPFTSTLPAIHRVPLFFCGFHTIRLPKPKRRIDWRNPIVNIWPNGLIHKAPRRSESQVTHWQQGKWCLSSYALRIGPDILTAQYDFYICRLLRVLITDTLNRRAHSELMSIVFISLDQWNNEG